MLCTEKPKVDYDSIFDVLHYAVGNGDNSRAVEDYGNVEVFRDFDTDEITGYTVFNFKSICETRSEEYQTLTKLFDVNQVAELCGFSD